MSDQGSPHGSYVRQRSQSTGSSVSHSPTASSSAEAFSDDSLSISDLNASNSSGRGWPSLSLSLSNSSMDTLPLQVPHRRPGKRRRLQFVWPRDQQQRDGRWGNWDRSKDIMTGRGPDICRCSSISLHFDKSHSGEMRLSFLIDSGC